MAARSPSAVAEIKGGGGEAVSPGENLPLLYQGLRTGILRLQTQRQRLPESESFRRRTKATLEEIERVAIAGGYDGRDVRDTHFAVVAFLDEMILNAKDPVREESGQAMAFEVQVLLEAKEVPYARLTDEGEDAPGLGWLGWLKTGPFANPVDDAVSRWVD